MSVHPERLVSSDDGLSFNPQLRFELDIHLSLSSTLSFSRLPQLDIHCDFATGQRPLRQIVRWLGRFATTGTTSRNAFMGTA